MNNHLVMDSSTRAPPGRKTNAHIKGRTELDFYFFYLYGQPRIHVGLSNDTVPGAGSLTKSGSIINEKY